MPNSYCNAAYASWLWHFTTCRHCYSFSRKVYDDARLIAVAHYYDERAKFHIHVYDGCCGQRTCLNAFKGQTQDWSHSIPGAISSYAKTWASDDNVASLISLRMLLYLISLPKHTLTTPHREVSWKSFVGISSSLDDTERHGILLPISDNAAVSMSVYLCHLPSGLSKLPAISEAYHVCITYQAHQEARCESKRGKDGLDLCNTPQLTPLKDRIFSSHLSTKPLTVIPIW